jgi:hypothetical protein
VVKLAPSENEERTSDLDFSEACAVADHINCVAVHGSGPGECQSLDRSHLRHLELRLASAGTRRVSRSWWFP